MTSTNGLSNEEYLALETQARLIVYTHIDDLRKSINGMDTALLHETMQSLEDCLMAYPEKHLDFFVLELILILAANSEGTLRVGMGDI